MAKRGRKKHVEDRVEWCVGVPKHLSDSVEEQLSDPLTGRTRYGAKSKLVAKLLREWMEARKQEDKNLPELDLDELEKTE